MRAIGIAADLADTADSHRLAREALAQAGRLDILINNAGMSIRAPFWEVSDADFEYQAAVNYRAPFILCQHIARHFIDRRARGGRIVNISTIGAHSCHCDAAVYDSAKAGVEALTRNMAYELGPHGTSINCVIPSAIPERPGGEGTAAGSPAARFIPFGRAGRAEDIAAATLFFCLPESEFTTGQALLVDGAHRSYLQEP